MLNAMQKSLPSAIISGGLQNKDNLFCGDFMN